MRQEYEEAPFRFAENDVASKLALSLLCQCSYRVSETSETMAISIITLEMSKENDEVAIFSTFHPTRFHIDYFKIGQ